MQATLQNTIEKDIKEDEAKLITSLDNINENKNNIKVAIYAICCNELQFVDRWINSMNEADYIVVLDTGSTDGTYEKLLEYNKKNPDKYIIGQKIYNPWRFDTPRNDAMKLCPKDTDVYFSTDLDEILEPGWYKELVSKWDKNIHQRGSYMYTWSHLEDGTNGRTFLYNKIHTKEWVWKYPVHELLYNINTGYEYYSPEIECNFKSNIHLHHYPDHNKSRENYLSLLELRAKENDNDYCGLMYLGHEYYYHKMYDNSIKTLNKILNTFKNTNTIDTASCYLFIGDCYKEKEDYYNSHINYLKAINIEPTYREPYLELGDLLIREKKYIDAIGIIKSGLENSVRHYTWLERDNSWLDQPYDLLSIAYYYFGNKSKSLIYAIKAYSLNKSNERLKKNIELILENMSNEDFISL